MTHATILGGLAAVVGSLLVSSPVSAQSGPCLTASGWRTGNNSDESEQTIGELGDNGMMMLEFHGPASDTGRPVGYTTFAAPVEGLVRGARYRLHLVFQRERNSEGILREVSLSAAGLEPQSRVMFRYPGRQSFEKGYVARSDRAMIMIHMRGFNMMHSYAGVPRLCPI